MYKNKVFINGKERNNIAGLNIEKMRKTKDWSQNDLAIALQNHGIDVHKNAVQEMEAGKRFITDIELKTLAKIFNTLIDDLVSLPEDKYSK